MKQSLLNYIECPLCRAELELIVLDKQGTEIKTGLLLCRQMPSHVFPIINEVPRLIEGSLANYLDTIMKFQSAIPEAVKSRMNEIGQLGGKYLHIQKSFSSEWEEVGESARAWGQDVGVRKKLLLHCLAISEADLKEKNILDAGLRERRGGIELGKYRVRSILRGYFLFSG